MEIRGRGRTTARAVILDASAKGLLMYAQTPPPRGEVAEIILGRQVLMGEVRWIKGNEFGVGLRERLDVDALVRGANAPITVQPRTARQDEPQQAETVDYLWLAVGALASLIAIGIILKFIF